jgi:hypothetical protein
MENSLAPGAGCSLFAKMKRASGMTHADENLAVLRHISVNVLRKARSSRVGIHAKRLKAGWDNHYLLRVLDGVHEMQVP